jgi:hypothetical protein
VTDYHRRTTCRCCKNGDLTQVLDLGLMPPANAFLKREDFDAEKRYPLTLAYCRDCALIQVPDVVDPSVLFNSAYAYETGVSVPMVEHFKRYAEEAVFPLVSKDDLVVDIGGNDGTLLSFGHAKVITANNVLAHVDDVVDFLRGVRHLLADDGTFIFEVHWVKDLLDRTGYDQIYHEHLCYFSLYSLTRMLDAAGLEIFDAEIVPMHGRSLRVKACKSRVECVKGATQSYHDILAAELVAGLDKADPYIAFGHRVEAKRHVLRDLLYDLKDGGAVIIGYGAPAKGTTLLNYCGIGPETLDCVVDTSPLKQGRYVPGVHVPVVGPELLDSDRIDYVLLLSWNYADYILEKEKELRDAGTKFILPFPEISVV